MAYLWRNSTILQQLYSRLFKLNKIMKKYLDIKCGYIRFKNKIELNWSIYDWALPLSIDFSSKYLLFIRILCISLIYERKVTK